MTLLQVSNMDWFPLTLLIFGYFIVFKQLVLLCSIVVRMGLSFELYQTNLIESRDHGEPADFQFASWIEDFNFRYHRKLNLGINYHSNCCSMSSRRCRRLLDRSIAKFTIIAVTSWSCFGWFAISAPRSLNYDYLSCSYFFCNRLHCWVPTFLVYYQYYCRYYIDCYCSRNLRVHCFNLIVEHPYFFFKFSLIY